MSDPELGSRGWAGLRVLVVAPTPTEPLDFGNRKRTFHVCAELKARGASIHYVHYASEADWRRNPPLAANRVMQASWDTLYTVPVTRPLHTSAADYHHAIDEWWDPAIGDMLTWLFATQSFDVLIVNYTWLSKALEFAPHGVLKVLDTHDRFSGRREMLEANGLAPEFFYTNEEQERIALDRADVVWAIKQQEEEHFRAQTSRPVVTVPYVEAIRPLNRTPMPNGIMRFGLVGARNNINLANMRAFLNAVRLYVEKTLLPCEFHVAGSCCDDLKHDRLPPYVKLIGRVPEMTDFYRSVDAVLAPMTFSTGLKIKVGEALNLGKALIAHEHAFEGYEPAHEFHTLPSFEACLWACKELVARPERIAELEHASIRSSFASARMVADSLDRTVERHRNLQRGACVVIDIAEVRSGSLIFDHFCEVGRYLGWQGAVHLVIGGELNGEVDGDAAHRLGQLGDLVLLPRLHAASAARLGEIFGRPNLRCRSYADLASEGHAALWFAGPPPAGEPLPRRVPLPAFMALETFALKRPEAEFAHCIGEVARSFSALHVLSRDDNAAVSAARRHPRVQHHRAPLFFKGHQAYAMWALERADRDGILVLADAPDDPLISLLRGEAERHGAKGLEVMFPAGHGDGHKPEGYSTRAMGACFKDIWDQRRAPELVLDISTGAAPAALREAFERAGLPWLRLFTGQGKPHITGWAHEFEARGALASLRLLRAALQDRATFQQLARHRMEAEGQKNDPGWAVIWDTVAEYRRAQAAA